MWRWHFVGHEDLQRGLEEYASLQDGTKTTHYGEREGEGSGVDEKRHCIMRQNAEIDSRMERLAQTAPTLYRLLDAYYRRGMGYEVKGWAVAAKHSGLPSDPANRFNRLCFEEVTTLAINELFHTRPAYKDVRPVDTKGNLMLPS